MSQDTSICHLLAVVKSHSAQDSAQNISTTHQTQIQSSKKLSGTGGKTNNISDNHTQSTSENQNQRSAHSWKNQFN